MVADMTKGNPLKLILTFAVPMLIGNIFQQIYSFADAAILGYFVGDSALASVGATMGIVGILISSIMGFTNGAGIIISQALGAKRFNEMKKTVTALIYIVTVMSVIIGVLGIVFCRPILMLLATPEDIIENSAVYIKILFIFVPSTVCYNASSAILRSMGNAKTPLISLIIATILNAGLDVLFIAKFNMGVSGAAIATGIAQIVSAIFNISFIIIKRKELNLETLPMFPKLINIIKIVKTGLPGALESSLLSLGTLSVQRLINTFGSATISAYTAATKIDSIAIAPIVSVGSAISVYSAQNMGAGNTERIKHGLYRTLVVLLCICLVIAVCTVTFRRQLLGIFIESSESIEIGSRYLIIVSIAYFVAAIMRSYLNVLRGAGDVNTSAIAGISELATRIIFAYILVVPFGTTGIWIATPIAWSCGAAIPVIRYYSGKWKDKRLV